MALLNLNKKLKSSTLVETLVSTVILLVIFTISTLTLNNLFKVSQKQNTLNLDHRIKKLIYLSHYHKISLPYHEQFTSWEIFIEKKESGNNSTLEITAEQIHNPKSKIYIIKYVSESF